MGKGLFTFKKQHSFFKKVGHKFMIFMVDWCRYLVKNHGENHTRPWPAMARVRCFLVHSDGPFFATSQVQLRRAKALGRVEDAAVAASAGNARPLCLDDGLRERNCESPGVTCTHPFDLKGPGQKVVKKSENWAYWWAWMRTIQPNQLLLQQDLSTALRESTLCAPLSLSPCSWWTPCDKDYVETW